MTIAYDISGNRSKIDQRIDKIVEEDDVLQKIDYVNTLLYWQCRITGNDKDELNSKVKNLLAKKLKEIFIDPTNRSQSTVRAF